MLTSLTGSTWSKAKDTITTTYKTIGRFSSCDGFPREINMIPMIQKSEILVKEYLPRCHLPKYTYNDLLQNGPRNIATFVKTSGLDQATHKASLEHRPHKAVTKAIVDYKNNFLLNCHPSTKHMCPNNVTDMGERSLRTDLRV